LPFNGASSIKRAMADSILTIIAAPAAQTLIAAATKAASDALERLGAHVGPLDWLSPDEACDLPFDGLDADHATAAARAALEESVGSAAIDLIAQAATGRRKSLLVADMESTIIVNEMLDELADLLGLRAMVAEITRRAMNDEIDFSEALRERVGLLKNLPETALDEAGTRIRLMPGARTLVATMKRHDAHAVLVSGGFRRYTGRIRQELDFDADVANELLVENGRLTGTVREPILTRAGKLDALKRFAAEYGVPLGATIAVGDGANDLPMIEAAGLGVAYHGKPSVAARARARVDHNDLTALLFAQGYRREEFVDG
jgi:phosphoserine phosphatase